MHVCTTQLVPLREQSRRGRNNVGVQENDDSSGNDGALHFVPFELLTNTTLATPVETADAHACAFQIELNSLGLMSAEFLSFTSGHACHAIWDLDAA